MLPPLATITDLTAFRYDVETVAPLLDRASARIRGFVRQQITAGESTVTLTYPYRLPQRPVVSVTSVADAAGGAVDFTPMGAGYLGIKPAVGTVTVEYTHGFTEVPYELRELTCAIAHRMSKTSDTMVTGVRSESVGNEQVTYGADAYEGVSGLTNGEEKALRRLFPKLPASAAIDPM